MQSVKGRAIFSWTVEEQLKEEFFADTPNGFFVDVGANEPINGSQTWHLEQKGWRGVLIEPQPQLAQRLKEQRRALVFACACSSPQNAGKIVRFPLFTLGDRALDGKGVRTGSLDTSFFVPGMHREEIIEAPARTLDDVLVEANAPVPIDLVSIDVEGHEVEVLSGLTLTRWRPRLILIEDRAFSLRLHRVLRSVGYKWVRRTGLNGWYVPNGSPMPVSLFGRWQFFRKHYINTPFRNVQDAKRRLRESSWIGKAAKQGAR